MSLTQQDYVAAAQKLGVEVAAVRAVASVESSGKGFFQNGKPVILYERHIFHKELTLKRTTLARNRVKLENPTLVGTQLDAKIAVAVKQATNEITIIASQNPGICNKSTGGYVGGVKEYDRLEKAKAIDEECALRSCSWGAFQVMGFHAEFLGFKNVTEMVAAAGTDVGQLDIFIRFIQKNPSLLKALKAKAWPEFARLYNGPAFAKNQYDTKLTAAFNQFTNNSTLA